MPHTPHRSDRRKTLGETADSHACQGVKKHSHSPSGTFARNLMLARTCANMKLYVAAQNLGVSPSTWSQWENGKRFPSLRTLAEIAASLGLQPCMLLKPDGYTCPSASFFHHM